MVCVCFQAPGGWFFPRINQEYYILYNMASVPRIIISKLIEIKLGLIANLPDGIEGVYSTL